MSCLSVRLKFLTEWALFLYDHLFLFTLICARCAQRCTRFLCGVDAVQLGLLRYCECVTDLALMGEDEWASARMSARLYNTRKLRGVLEVLEPYVDGSIGVVSAPHLKLYLQTLKDLGALYQLSAPPGLSVAGVDEGQVALAAEAAVRQAVSVLEALEPKTRRRAGM